MFQSIFRNMQPVVKNLLIINVLFFLATFVFAKQGIDLNDILGLHYISSPSFQPFQFATNFFLHADIMHILFNMIGLVVFGNVLERLWGSKRFLTFYFITAIGASVLYLIVQGIELKLVTGTFFPDGDWINSLFTIKGNSVYFSPENEYLFKPWQILNKSVIGASGAVYGLLMAVALLFPNTEVYLYFAIPVKMKWLALGLGVFALFKGFQEAEGDSVAHFAHLGGMLFGFILIKIWQRNKSNFY